MNTNERKGGISVDTEHIFPIIKRWLYSEKEIFLREIVSNACDAVTKLKRLSSLGEVKGIDDEYRIDIVLDKDEGTLTVKDNGIGMTQEELEKYICNIALSGAVEFIKKYENDDSGKPQEGIIGHFGLGFYSSFMVSDTVSVISRSYTDSPAVLWVSDSEGNYTVSPSDRESRGTDIVMKISEDESEFLEEAKIRSVINKYCAFMPVPIYFTVLGEEEKEPELVNDPAPVWTKPASECTDEDYIEFYKKVFNDYREPLFWVHINADYPLNFKGVIFFPKLNTEYEKLDGQIKLYYNQVFVADNIEEVIPEYLLMLRGVLDCPELPLNVSRSYLQNSGYVSKISMHIVKKVADRINGLFNTDREKYEKLYDDIKLFIEYACIRDKKFFDRVKNSVLYKSVKDEEKYFTLNEYLTLAEDAHKGVVYYATDKTSQIQYISAYTSQGAEVVLLDKMLDTQFISAVEAGNEEVRFSRIDSEIADSLKADGEAVENEAVRELFKAVSGKEDIEISFINLKDASTPAFINIGEQERRFSDMMKMYRMDGMDTMPEKMTLAVNTSSRLYSRLLELINSGKEDSAGKVARQIYTLSLIAQRQLSAEELKSFLDESFEILMDVE